MGIATALFAAMVFKWGWVHPFLPRLYVLPVDHNSTQLHSDLHPGNVLVRPHPSDKSRPQIVRPSRLASSFPC